MKYTDHHVHTYFSPDSEATIEEYLLKAKDLGLSSVIFTDHADMGAIEVDFRERIDYKKYFKTMKALEEKYEIPIKIGIEIGYEKDYKSEIDELLGDYPFDFVLASIHYGDRKDFYMGDFYQGKSQEESYRRYFEIMLEMVENFSNFDIVGHFDYIVKYGDFKDKKYDFNLYKDLIDEILKTIIRKSKGIEINTSGLRGPLNTTFPKEDILKRYRELGGEIITIGSDSHFIEEYYEGVRDELKHMKNLGFEEVTTFSKRKGTQILLNNYL